MCDMLSDMVESMGYHASCATTLREGLAMISSGPVDVVFLDIRMPDGSGLDTLPRIKALPSSPEVIIITGMGDPDGAEIAIKNGAWDYIQKSSSIKEMTLPFMRALQYREEKRTRRPLAAFKAEGMVGNCAAIRKCLDIMAEAAQSDASVLIVGETGTGKEVCARAIHDNGPMAARNFVVVDCASLPDTLVESVLFGHEKGAFTGADKSQEGLIRQAHGGTLFLDEIGELPFGLQKTFLRVLQERRFRPVGGKWEVESNFRLVAATNRDLGKLAAEGYFRTDLLFRLTAFTIELPPLRERRDDIRDLAVYFMMKTCERYAIGTKGFSPEFLEALLAYEWPGNVRELINAMERVIASAKYEPTLYPNHLPTEIRAKIARSSVLRELGGTDPLNTPLATLEEYRDIAERRYLQDLLLATRGNIQSACATSGMSRSRLYALIKKHGLNNSKGPTE